MSASVCKFYCIPGKYNWSCIGILVMARGQPIIRSLRNIEYDIPGTYIVSLTGYGANGISVISYDTITVKGPFAKLYSPLDQACAPAADTLHATASYIGSYTWDFGDGTVLTTQDSIAVHTYILPGLFTPALILTDSTGCQMSYKSDHQILIDTLFAASGSAGYTMWYWFHFIMVRM